MSHVYFNQICTFFAHFSNCPQWPEAFWNLSVCSLSKILASLSPWTTDKSNRIQQDGTFLCPFLSVSLGLKSKGHNLIADGYLELIPLLLEITGKFLCGCRRQNWWSEKVHFWVNLTLRFHSLMIHMTAKQSYKAYEVKSSNLQFHIYNDEKLRLQ